MPSKKSKGRKKKNIKVNVVSSDEDATEDEYFSKTEGEEENDDYEPKLNMLCNTHYDSVKEAGKMIGFHLRKKANKEWDNAWLDSPYNIKFLK